MTMGVWLNLTFLLLAAAASFGLYVREDLIHKGGPVMVPILVCSMYAVAIILERLVYLYSVQVNRGRLMQEMAQAVQRQRMLEAIELCDKTPGPMGGILKAGLLKHDKSRAEIREAIADRALHELPAVERYLGFLAAIAQIAPLLGLLGTVTGMVRCFQVVQLKSTTLAPVSPGDLAGGIWEALITTVAGLVVAIPTYFAYHYLSNQANHRILEMEQSATELVNLLSERSEFREPSAPAPAARQA